MALQLQISSGKRALGPFDTYHLSHGLTLNFSSTHGTVKGGLSSSVTFPLLIESQDPAFVFSYPYHAKASVIEKETGATLSVIKSNLSTGMAFRIDDSIISHMSLSEELLTKLTFLEPLVKKRIADCFDIEGDTLSLGLEACATLDDFIRDGKLGPTQLDLAIVDLAKKGVPIKESFFMFNAEQSAEDMRHAILSACHCFATMTLQMCEINQNCQILSLSGQQPTQPEETILMSEEVDLLSFGYMNAVINCYSALDMLYELFVYLTREPFGNPEFPRQLHFPDASVHKVFQKGSMPSPSDPPNTIYLSAIPNLRDDYFGALRHARNDLVHNMAADGLRPRVYVGWRLPPVSNLPLQYVQYLTRDFAIDGVPVTHPLYRRFYETQMDAQDTLYDWIERTWQCIFDTIEWLIYRMQGSSITGASLGAKSAAF